MPKRKIDNNFVPSESYSSSEESEGELEGELEAVPAGPYMPEIHGGVAVVPVGGHLEEKADLSESSGDPETEFYLGSNDKRVEVKVFNGTVRVDIRSYFRDKDGEWKPTQKGVSLLASEFSDLMEARNDIYKAIDHVKGMNNKKRKT